MGKNLLSFRCGINFYWNFSLARLFMTLQNVPRESIWKIKSFLHVVRKNKFKCSHLINVKVQRFITHSSLIDKTEFAQMLQEG